MIEATSDLIIHAVVYADVDGAERGPGRVMAINVSKTEQVAGALVGVRGICTSTDRVFSGWKQSPYDEQDSPAPQLWSFQAARRLARPPGYSVLRLDLLHSWGIRGRPWREPLRAFMKAEQPLFTAHRQHRVACLLSRHFSL
ncbi:sugar nucleotide-binding protein [Nitrospira sp. NS4]|uniref:sugar nucleotide-binding protein n=1 Tax=Nitrospira sp. NS4 TaxID=3414498 RepID=UPI003C2FDD9B